MVTPPALMAPSGRVYFRHSSGMGSVMIFNDIRTWRRILVLDAKYRTKKRFGLFGVEIPEFQEYQIERPNIYWLDDYPTERSTEPPDSWISENITWDPMTSQERCDIWMKYKNGENQINPPILGCPAVAYCRNIQVNGIPCDLPNIQTLARIFVDRETIDQMDPTVEEYSMWSLVRWSFSDTRVTWSSTEHSRHYVWHTDWDGYCGTTNNKNCIGGIIPILELQ